MSNACQWLEKRKIDKKFAFLKKLEKEDEAYTAVKELTEKFNLLKIEFNETDSN